MTEHEQKPLLYAVREGIARLTLNRAEKRNALNDELIAALKEALRHASVDAGVSAIVIDGAGADFCSGADLSALQKISAASVAENLEDARGLMELFMMIREIQVPVIAAVRGRALAGGCGLALACDLVIAARSARFGFPEVKIGFVPAMVTAILRRNLSEKRAFQLVALGDEINAETAEAIGLINLAVVDDRLEMEVEELSRRFTRLSRSAISLTKRLLYDMDGLALKEAFSAGVDVNATARMTVDCRRGIELFLKRS
jgi:methylglutaconyl-CoA hydratase